MAYSTLLLLIAATSHAAIENFDDVAVSDAILTQTRVDGEVSPTSIAEAKATMNSPLVVEVNVTQAYSSQLPPGWNSTTSLPSQSALDRSVQPPQTISSPIIDGQVRFTSWTIVNKFNWDELAYQWLYGGQYPRYSSSSGIDIRILARRYNPTFQTQFDLTMEETAVAARAARRQFSLGLGNIIVADFNMWFGDCLPDHSANPTFVTIQESFLRDTVRGIVRDSMLEQYCKYSNSERRYFNSTLYSPWMTAIGLDVDVVVRFDSDWFVAVQDSDGTRSCCGPTEAMNSALKPVAYDERGKVILEVETASGTTAVFNTPLRTWRPIPYADRGKLQPPRNEAVTLVWSNPQRLSLKRVRVLWVVEKGYNQGFWALDNINITVVGSDPSTPASTASTATTSTTQADSTSTPTTTTSRTTTLGSGVKVTIPSTNSTDDDNALSIYIAAAVGGLLFLAIVAWCVCKPRKQTVFPDDTRGTSMNPVYAGPNGGAKHKANDGYNHIESRHSTAPRTLAYTGLSRGETQPGTYTSLARQRGEVQQGYNSLMRQHNASGGDTRGEAYDQPNAPSPAREAYDQPNAPPPAREAYDQPNAPPPAREAYDQPNAPPPAREACDQPNAPPPAREAYDQPNAPPPAREAYDQPNASPPAREAYDQPNAPPPAREAYNQPNAPPPAREAYDQSNAPPPAREAYDQPNATGVPQRQLRTSHPTPGPAPELSASYTVAQVRHAQPTMGTHTLKKRAGLTLSDTPPWLTELSRDEAMRMVSSVGQDGAFVVRPSSRPHAWAITVQHPNGVTHHLIEDTPRGLYVDDQITNLASLVDVIELLKHDKEFLGVKLTRAAVVDETSS